MVFLPLPPCLELAYHSKKLRLDGSGYPSWLGRPLFRTVCQCRSLKIV